MGAMASADERPATGYRSDACARQRHRAPYGAPGNVKVLPARSGLARVGEPGSSLVTGQNLGSSQESVELRSAIPLCFHAVVIGSVTFSGGATRTTPAFLSRSPTRRGAPVA